MGNELTQDELDELLKGSSLNSSKDYIKGFSSTIDGLSGLFSGSLSTLLSEEVKLSVLNAEELGKENIENSSDEGGIISKFTFSSGAEGNMFFLLDKPASLLIASTMMGSTLEELNDDVIAAISETSSTLAANTCTNLSSKLSVDLSTEPGTSSLLSEGVLDDIPYFTQKYVLNLGSEKKGNISLIVDSEIAKKFGETNKKGANMSNENGSADKMQQVQFSNFNGQGTNLENPKNIGLLMDVYMEMTVELGRTKRLIKDILTMGEGTIIELDKIAGEPADILVNHKLVAKGEVVVIDENFGIRVTEIVSPTEKINPF